MQRDFELIRKILLEVQDAPPDTGPMTIHFPGEYEQSLVDGHIELLIEAGLIKGRTLRTMSGLRSAVVQGLTWEGHDFIKAAENASLWKNALEMVKEKGGALTFDVLKELLKSLALKAAGLS